MSVRVTTAEGCPGVHDLYRWLTEDPDVAGAAEVALVNEDDGAEALGSLEVISIVVSNLTRDREGTPRGRRRRRSRRRPGRHRSRLRLEQDPAQPEP
ncbi:hypothetical protein [Streptomyces sp. NPDC059455]|uniref:effector-associated constant component EACC1 n=1 Tax=Streptomyces sp. NPDC059455 TaxID=3346837 RepID=UPI003683D469